MKTEKKIDLFLPFFGFKKQLYLFYCFIFYNYIIKIDK